MSESMIDWLRTWLPAVEYAEPDRREARLRAALVKLDVWEHAIGRLRVEFTAQLEEYQPRENEETK